MPAAWAHVCRGACAHVCVCVCVCIVMETDVRPTMCNAAQFDEFSFLSLIHTSSPASSPRQCTPPSPWTQTPCLARHWAKLGREGPKGPTLRRLIFDLL